MKIAFLAKLFVRFFDKLDRFLCRSLPRSIRFWWAMLWIREDEFHPSLDFDFEYAYLLSAKGRDAYWLDLARRRGIVHERDLAKEQKIYRWVF